MRIGTSLAVQWVRLHASTAGGTGSIPGWGAKIAASYAVQPKKKKKRNENICLYYCFLLNLACLNIFSSFHFKIIAYNMRCLVVKETLVRLKNCLDSQILPPHARFFDYVGKLDGLDVRPSCLLLLRTVNLTCNTYN